MTLRWLPFRFSGNSFAQFGLAVLLLSTLIFAQQPAQNPPPDQKPQQETPPAAGGPGGDTGPYVVVPKKKEEAPPPPEKPKKIEGMPDYSIRVDVPLVNVDVLVTAKDGQFVPGLKKENFRITEDGNPQTVTNFNMSEAPITAVLLIEFAAYSSRYLYDALNASYNFAGQLKKEDWVAVVAYDMKPQILVDFTQDKKAIYGALGMLRVPGFNERNLFDSLYDTIDRLEGSEGRKYIILISSGMDTFSKLNYDQILKKVKATKDITIYPVGIGRVLREMADARGMVGPITQLDWLQADNQMNTFARMTGGRAYFPRFEAEYGEIFRDIGSSIRNQYSLGYHPTNAKLDGSYRKLKVELVAPDGKPLKIVDQKGKELKYTIIAREGYTAKHVVE